MTLEQLLYKQRDFIMDTFDFRKVSTVMEVLQWDWASANGVPEEWEIRQKARQLMNSVITSALKQPLTPHGLSTGGFHVNYRHGFEAGEYWACIDLSFNLEDTLSDGESYTPSSTKSNSRCTCNNCSCKNEVKMVQYG